jgi:protein tyrosine phosphatase (PTP) superfamily phosphohydrolase (DUF442 family)
MKRWLISLFIVLGILYAAWMLLKNNFHEVIPGELYRSAQLSTGKLEEVIQEHGIRTLVSLRRPRPDKSWYKNEIAISESLGITRYDIAFDFTFSPRIDHLMELRDLLEEAPKPLLVYCRGGADRTGLASLMAKLLDGSSSLEDAREQISLEFYAVREDTMGVPIFNEYTAWLQSNGYPHSKDHFNHWLENEYTDLSGNIHFLVDPIREQLWQRPWGLIEEGHVFDVDRKGSDILELSGWAFDSRNTSLLDSVEVYLGELRFDESWYGIYQPWLIKDFGKEEYLDAGWMASHPLDQFDDGCYDLRLKFNRQDGSSWTSPPSARICIA